VICLIALIPVATTVLISFKGERDTIRKPPVIFPCDTETSAFDPTACRWALEGYQRVLAPQATAGGLLPFTLTGNMVRTYIPNSLLYATSTALLVVLLAGMAGYAFSRYRFRGHRALMVAILAITGVPLLTNLLALYQMGITLRKASIPFYDDRLFLIAVYLGFFLPAQRLDRQRLLRRHPARPGRGRADRRLLSLWRTHARQHAPGAAWPHGHFSADLCQRLE
jgi:ABC-type glycerol-3-phosphate transport system permease component